MFHQIENDIIINSDFSEDKDIEAIIRFNDFINFKRGHYTNMEEDSNRMEKLDKLTAFYEDLLLEEGCSALVYKPTNNVVLKYFLDYSIFETGEIFDNDALILRNIGDLNIYPKLLAYRENTFMVTEFIKCESLSNVPLENISYDEWLNFFESLAVTYKDKGYLPQDLHQGNIKVTTDNKLIVIDVGAFQFNESPTINIQKFMRLKKYRHLLRMYYTIMDSHGIEVDDDMIEVVESGYVEYLKKLNGNSEDEDYVYYY